VQEGKTLTKLHEGYRKQTKKVLLRVMWFISTPDTSLRKELRKYNCMDREEWFLVTILANGKYDNSRPVLQTAADTIRETVIGVNCAGKKSMREIWN